MSKKIEWIKRGMTANNSLHMQEVCDQIANETSPENLTSVIKGSDTVVVDVAEDKKTVEVHLDAEVTQKIDNSLQAPTQAPTATQIVGVGTNKAQTMLNIGDGLSIENGSLKASGGSGGKLYHKFALFNVNNQLDNVSYIRIDYYSSTSLIPSSYEELKTDIMGKSLMGNTPCHCGVGFELLTANTDFLFIPAYYTVGKIPGIRVFYQKLDISSGTPVITPSASINLTDTIFAASVVKVEEV